MYLGNVMLPNPIIMVSHDVVKRLRLQTHDVASYT